MFREFQNYYRLVNRYNRNNKPARNLSYVYSQQMVVVLQSIQKPRRSSFTKQNIKRIDDALGILISELSLWR